MSENIEAKIAAIISDTLRLHRGIDLQLDNDLSLIDGGILDSLSIVNVVRDLQDQFDIEIVVSDITLDNFDSIALIANFVKNRMA